MSVICWPSYTNPRRAVSTVSEIPTTWPASFTPYAIVYGPPNEGSSVITPAWYRNARAEMPV